MTAVIFMGGLNRQVVMGKWEGFLDAFQQFDVTAVADFTDVDVERLSQDERIIRYKAKIRSVADNAREMQRIGAEHGSFSAWLQQRLNHDGVDATAKELGKRFKYMSEALPLCRRRGHRRGERQGPAQVRAGRLTVATLRRSA
jgi:3-methyladenine DNA glycosylase Tag